MKLNNFKKVNKEFDPVGHWYFLLIIIFVILIVILMYTSYAFFRIKSEISAIEIESKNNIQNSTSAELLEKSSSESKFLKNINNLNKILDEYDKKEAVYNRLINNVAKITVNVSTSTSSTTVATSTQ